MGSDKSKAYWENMANNIQNPGETTNKRSKEYLLNDIRFIKTYLEKDDVLLDVGAGSGLVVNELVDDVKEIIAVETFEGLTNFIHKDIFVINAELPSFKVRKSFDKIIATGVLHFFPLKEAKRIYENIISMLSEGGTFVMRSHCGLTETVTVNGYSEELDSDYFSELRQIDDEVALLKSLGFKTVEVIDEVADELNVWPNSRHYYFICKK